MRRRGWIGSALAGVTVVTLLAGCSSQENNADNATREPATPAAAPAAKAAPAGEVSPSAPISLLFDEPATGVLAAVVDSGTTLQLSDQGRTRSITLPGKAAALSAGKPGEILVAVPGKIVRVDAATGAVTELGVDGDVRSAALRSDGTLVAGLANGKVVLLDADGTVRHTISGLSSADAVDVREGAIVVLDRRQTAIVQTDGDTRLGLSLRAGDGATNMIGDHFGRRLVTDTAAWGTAGLHGRSLGPAPAFPGRLLSLRTRLRSAVRDRVGDADKQQRSRRLRPVDGYTGRGGALPDGAPAQRGDHRRPHR